MVAYKFFLTLFTLSIIFWWTLVSPTPAQYYTPGSRNYTIDVKVHPRFVSRLMKNNTIVHAYLTEQQYQVTFRNGSDMRNYGYSKNENNGTYNCRIWDEFLFDSKDKFPHHPITTQWPTFKRIAGNVKIAISCWEKFEVYENEECRWGNCNSHLGDYWTMPDDPKWKRYEVSSSALVFKPATTEDEWPEDSEVFKDGQPQLDIDKDPKTSKGPVSEEYSDHPDNRPKIVHLS